MPKVYPRTVQRNIYVFDSGTHEEFLAHRIYAVAYEPFWQTLRMKLAFRTEEDVSTSLARMDAYISLEDPGHPLHCALWRCYNLINALPHGQVNMKSGLHYVSANSTDVLKEYQESLVVRIHATGQPEYWDWNDTRTNLIQMCASGFEYRTQVSQVAKALARARGKKPEPKLELRYFLAMVEAVLPKQSEHGGENVT